MIISWECTEIEMCVFVHVCAYFYVRINARQGIKKFSLQHNILLFLVLVSKALTCIVKYRDFNDF